MEQEETQRAINLPLEIWFRIFHYVRVKDTLQLSLVCEQFRRLLQSNTLWRHYCRRENRSLSTSQINQFPSCKDLYRDILKPFSWSLGYTFMFPGQDKATICKIQIQDRALVIAPTSETKKRDKVLLKVVSEDGKRRIEKASKTGDMELLGDEEALQFIKRNVVVFFFDRYMNVDHELLIK